MDTLASKARAHLVSVLKRESVLLEQSAPLIRLLALLAITALKEQVQGLLVLLAITALLKPKSQSSVQSLLIARQAAQQPYPVQLAQLPQITRITST